MFDFKLTLSNKKFIYALTKAHAVTIASFTGGIKAPRITPEEFFDELLTDELGDETVELTGEADE